MLTSSGRPSGFLRHGAHTPPPAPMAAYLAMLDALRMDRRFVQAVHGTDNRAMLEALGATPTGCAARGRERRRTDRELETLARAGVIVR